jgi:hypothetical protein
MPGRITRDAGEGIMTGEATEDQDLEQPLRAATEALRETVLRLLRVGEVHPQRFHPAWSALRDSRRRGRY